MLFIDRAADTYWFSLTPKFHQGGCYQMSSCQSLSQFGNCTHWHLDSNVHIVMRRKWAKPFLISVGVSWRLHAFEKQNDFRNEGDPPLLCPVARTARGATQKQNGAGVRLYLFCWSSMSDKVCRGSTVILEDEDVSCFWGRWSETMWCLKIWWHFQ